MAKSKKLTAIIATGCAAVMALSGTFAWILQQDETKLNEFSHYVEDYGVKVEETFEPFVDKDVTVKATGEGSVIVRMRYEEFLSVDGADTDVAQTSGIYTATTLADVAHEGTNDARKDTSKLDPKLVDLYFGKQIITMAEWNALIAGKTGADLNAIYNAGYWVIDTDGWCYYTKPLKDTEASNLSMANALLSKTDAELAELYGAPANLDYNINVRVQAISADLTDYGSTTDNSQWTCATTGRVIEDDVDNSFEILTNTPVVAASDADKLIRGVSNGAGFIQSNGYAFSLNSYDNTAQIAGFSTSTSSISDVTGYESGTLTMPTTITYNEVSYTVTSIAPYAFYNNAFLNNVHLILPEKVQTIGKDAFCASAIIGELVIPESVSLIDYEGFSRTTATSIVFRGANEIEAPIYVVNAENEAAALKLGDGAFSHVTYNGVLRLPTRTSELTKNVFYGSRVSEVQYPANATIGTYVWTAFSGTKTPYTVE